DTVLTNAGNDFQAVVSVTADNASIVDTNNVDIGLSNVASTINVTSGGGITVSGVVTANDLVFNASSGAGDIPETTGSLDVSGTSTFTVQGTDDITLGAAANDFGIVSVTNAQNVTIVDSDDIDIGATNAGATLDVTSGLGITVSGSVNAGTLNFTASAGAGDITETTGDITVAGTSTFTVQATDSVALGNNNDFGTVSIPDALNVTVVDTSDIVLNAADIGGTLNVTANGTISGTQVITVDGVTTLNATGTATTTNDISLTNIANDLNTVIISNAGNVSFDDLDDIIFNTSTIGGTLDVDAGAIDFIGRFTAGAADLDATVAAGGVTDSAGDLIVAGATLINAQAGDDVQLDDPDNDFGSVGVTQANNVTLRDTNNVTLNAISAGGTLDVIANGSIT
ncbi:MAG: hypothetical protein MI865_06920, partial [Proteobacteria bacterium]|nr:hypothetical protein [Pseudomonadota bacterium]